MSISSWELNSLGHEACVAVAIKSTGYALDYISHFAASHPLFSQSRTALSSALGESLAGQPVESRLLESQKLLKLVDEIDVTPNQEFEAWINSKALFYAGLATVYMLIGGCSEFEQTASIGQEADEILNSMSSKYINPSDKPVDHVVKCLHCAYYTFSEDSGQYCKKVKRSSFDLVQDIREDIKYFTPDSGGNVKQVSVDFYKKVYPRQIYLFTFLARFLSSITGRGYNSPVRLNVRLHKTGLENILKNVQTSSKTSMDKDNSITLHQAAQTGDVSAATLLVSRAVQIDEKDSEGWTPLHYAAQNGHNEIADLLVSKGADLDARMPAKASALHIAAVNGHLSIAELLLSNGAQIDAVSDFNITPLHFAVEYNHIDLVSLLISRGAKVNARNGSSSTPLHIAALKGHAQAADLLLSSGAEVNARCNLGQTPMHIASFNGHTEVVSLLIERGALVDEKCGSGWTPLHYAAVDDRMQTVSLLISKGANVNIKTRDGKTALDIAREKGSNSVEEALK